MGAWGPGIFENDDALDWIAELQESHSLSSVTTVLDTVLDCPSGYSEAPDCAAALAAAEVIAVLIGNPGSSLPSEVDQWLDGYVHQEVNADLVNRARQVVDTILFKSELEELWRESDAYDEWRSAVTDLLSRLIAES